MWVIEYKSGETWHPLVGLLGCVLAATDQRLAVRWAAELTAENPTVIHRAREYAPSKS